MWTMLNCTMLYLGARDFGGLAKIGSPNMGILGLGFRVTKIGIWTPNIARIPS